MSDDTDFSAMRRKAGAGRPPPEIGRPTAATALRVAVAQAAEDVAALMALAAAVEETRIVRDRFVAALPKHALLALCDSEDGRFAMVVMDPQALAALIEVQTTGRVVPHKADPRPPTRTDAILSADFINRLLELFTELVAEAELPILPSVKGFRYALPMADGRAVAMTLEDIPYRQFTLTMDLGSGAKEGQVQLLFPHDPPRRPAVATEGPIDTVAEAVMDTQAEMNAVLHRLELPLTGVMALEPGALVPVPRTALSQVMLEGVTGAEISHGRLGQIGGHRAVRISEDQPGALSDATQAGGAVCVDPRAMPPPGSPPGDLPASHPPAMDLTAPASPGLSAQTPASGLPPPGAAALTPGDGRLPRLQDGDPPPLDLAPMPMADLPEPVG